MIEYTKEYLKDKDLTALFKEMDSNSLNVVSLDEFKEYFKDQANFKLEQDNLSDLFKALDTKNKGHIDLEQFLTVFKNKIENSIQ